MKGRLSWICHGPTRANREGRFPGDEPLEAKALERIQLPSGLATVDRAWTSPALRARQTAAACGLDVREELSFRECDYGRWQGRPITELHESDPEALTQWMLDFDAAPHGGEPLSAVLARVGDWMKTHIGDGGHTVVVTHATIIRAAILHVLQAPPAAFWTIDIEPLGIVEMTSDGRRWQLRFPNAAR
ncbi:MULTISPECIES: histidine phosphatase family protein [Rhizobium]|uniref:Broad specificity phosphatase PhoE n=1 Tax=Rhizobium paranaense TaxID=1650438 RepID=A0A7W8XWE3_9HYPH|nr:MULTISPECIES: histidine phosphatase family protein [Rhizobium]MBB5576822.1 broad specificity phosphatase PhoE [Rhizobium paranaense]PST64864.1 histidine phosphatase family protein [Rhizobium sp. SEMIA4064]